VTLVRSPQSCFSNWNRKLTRQFIAEVVSRLDRRWQSQDARVNASAPPGSHSVKRVLRMNRHLHRRASLARFRQGFRKNYDTGSNPIRCAMATKDPCAVSDRPGIETPYILCAPVPPSLPIGAQLNSKTHIPHSSGMAFRNIHRSMSQLIAISRRTNRFLHW